MTHLCKMMLDTLADIGLLLSFTPNARMQKIGDSYLHGSLRMVNAARRQTYDTVETIAAKRTSHDC